MTIFHKLSTIRLCFYNHQLWGHTPHQPSICSRPSSVPQLNAALIVWGVIFTSKSDNEYYGKAASTTRREPSAQILTLAPSDIPICCANARGARKQRELPHFEI